MPLPQQNGDGFNDEQAEEVLDEVVLKHFIVEPEELGPFQSGTLNWEVEVPRNPPVDVRVLLDNGPVAPAGSQQVAPPSTFTYRLAARAGRRSRPLGQVTVRVNLDACTTMTDTGVPLWIVGAVKQKIHERTDRVYLRSDPQAWITADTMHLRLSLGKSVDHFPDPTITIEANFGLVVVPGTAPPTVHHPVIDRPGMLQFPPKLAAVAKDIHTDVSFPWYAWLVPGAMIGLPIAISGAEGDAYRSADSMIDQIVDELLNGFFQGPRGTYKHDVRLYVDANGGEFAVTFCPIPRPQTSDGMV